MNGLSSDEHFKKVTKAVKEDVHPTNVNSDQFVQPDMDDGGFNDGGEGQKYKEELH